MSCQVCIHPPTNLIEVILELKQQRLDFLDVIIYLFLPAVGCLSSGEEFGDNDKQRRQRHHHYLQYYDISSDYYMINISVVVCGMVGRTWCARRNIVR